MFIDQPFIQVISSIRWTLHFNLSPVKKNETYIQHRPLKDQK